MNTRNPEVERKLLAMASVDEEAKSVLHDYCEQFGLEHASRSIGVREAGELMTGAVVASIAGSTLTLDNGRVIDISLDGD